MKYIQCFGGIGANIVDVTKEFVAQATTEFQTYVLYDPEVHDKFRPRDRVTASGIDSARRIKIEAAEIDLAVSATELEALAKNPRAANEDLDEKKAQHRTCEIALENAEKL